MKKTYHACLENLVVAREMKDCITERDFSYVGVVRRIKTAELKSFITLRLFKLNFSKTFSTLES